MRYTELMETERNYDLQARYAFYNELLFDRKLPTISLSWKPMKDAGGKVAFKVIRSTRPPPNALRVRLGLEDRRSNYDLVKGSIKMVISPQYKRSEQALDGLLIHEMIHVYMLTLGLLGEVHGAKFIGEVLRCEKIVGFDIPLKDRVAGLELADTVAVKAYGVVLLLLPNDKFAYAMLSAKLLQDNLELLKQRMQHAPSTGGSVRFYVIADDMWSKKALTTTVQRTIRFSLFRGTDPALLRDLIQHGTLLAKMEPTPAG